MMPIRGLLQEELVLPKQSLNARYGIYFSSLVFCMWDNIHGPKILKVWSGEEPSKGVLLPSKMVMATRGGAVGDDGTARMKMGSTDDLDELMCESLTDTEMSHFNALKLHTVPDSTLLTIANYTLNDEAGRVEQIDGIESKFYSLKKHGVIAHSSIFATEVVTGKTEVFSFILILPYSEMAEFLARHSFCESRLQRLLQEYMINPLKGLIRARAPVKDKINKVLLGFHEPLYKFTQTMLSLKTCALPERIDISDTFLGKDMPKGIVQHIITSHLQTSGYTIVIGTNQTAVNKMILTLALFLSPKERKMSRLVWEGEMIMYEPDLYLQGYVVKPDSTAALPISKNDLLLGKLPPTILKIMDDQYEIHLVEPKINVYICKRDEQLQQQQQQQLEGQRDRSTRGAEMLQVKDLASFKDFSSDLHSKLVADYMEQMKFLPTVGGVRETYTAQFVQWIKLKALAMTKYIEAEPKSNMQDLATDVLALGRLSNPTGERQKINPNTLMKDLAINSSGDLHVVLSFAEKIRARTYFDVLGDPKDVDRQMIREIETF